MKISSKKIAFMGLCTAVALILAYIEILLPPIFSSVPGIKMGLPNIIIIFVLYRFGVKSAFTVSFLRCILVLILFGNIMAFSYSIAGALLSLSAMALLKKFDFLSTVGVSVAGAILHNVGQIIMAIILLGTAELGYYLIVLSVTGTLSGIFIGLCGNLMCKRIPQ